MPTETIDAHRAQILRQQCARHFAGKRLNDIVGALEMLVADAIMSMGQQDVATAVAGADAILSDVRAIIRERFSMQSKAN